MLTPHLSLPVGSDQEKTFGPTISGLIQKHMAPESVCLWDTKKRGGRPDTMKLLKEAYESWNAEGESSARATQASFRCFFGIRSRGLPDSIQWYSLRLITLAIPRLCKGAKKLAYQHSAHYGTS